MIFHCPSGHFSAALLGAALGNIVRGVPLDANGYFVGPLFTDFRLGPHPGVLDWYTVLVGLFALGVLAGHGALYLVWKTTGPVQERSRRLARPIWIGTLAAGLGVTLATAYVQPQLFPHLFSRPWSWPLLAAGVVSPVLLLRYRRQRRELPAFLASATFIVSLLGATAAGMFPNILISTLSPRFTLDAYNAASGALSLRVGLVWWSLALFLSIGYFVLLYLSFRGKVGPGTELSDEAQPRGAPVVAAGTALCKGEKDLMKSRDGKRPLSPEENRPQVVIVGGGFGGLFAARALRNAPVRVTVIDRQNSHVFRPMLYQVATGILPANEIATPIRSILRRSRNTDVLMAEVTGIDTQNGRVLMGERSLTYDYLILATGVRDNYFGHDDWKSFAPGLHSLNDAEALRARLLGVFEEAERLAAGGAVDPEELQSLLTFVLVGAGPTGVEMAGSIAGLARVTLGGEFRHIDPRSARILLCEAAPRILSAYSEDLAGKARHRLEQMGVEVRTGEAVQQVDGDGVILGGQRIRSRTVIWSAGVSASPAGQWLGAEMDRAGRVKVNPDLWVPGHPNIFVVGDTASVVAPVRSLFRVGRRRPQPRPVPGLAGPAMQGGQYVARLITLGLRGLDPPRPFEYLDKGTLAIVGTPYAIADFQVVRLWGWPAWWTWLGVHVFFLIGLGNRLLVATQWAIALLSHRRGVRTFPGEAEETVRARAVVGG